MPGKARDKAAASRYEAEVDGRGEPETVPAVANRVLISACVVDLFRLPT